MTSSSAGATGTTELLTTSAAGELLTGLLRSVGQELRSWAVRGIHRRPRSLSVVYDVTADTGPAVLVAHVSADPVPAGAARVTVGDTTIHVWRYPNDPYCAGLSSAGDPARVRELLDRLGLPPGRVHLRTRSYRPSRRAVLEVTIEAGAGASRPLFLKVLGGRTPARLVERTRAVVAPHRALRDAGLPVPSVLGVAEGQGIVALTAIGGRTLRSVLLDPSAELPDAAPFVELTARIAATDLRSTADPRRFASAERHVESLIEAVPDEAARIREVAAAADLAAGPPGTVHGDLHDGQLLLHGGRISGVLDVDGAGTGLLAHDAGRLIAYVASIEHPDAAVERRAATFASRLLDAYGSLIGEDDLRRAVAGASLSLATGPGRTGDEDWRDGTRRRIQQAAEWLAR